MDALDLCNSSVVFLPEKSSAEQPEEAKQTIKAKIHNVLIYTIHLPCVSWDLDTVFKTVSCCTQKANLRIKNDEHRYL